MVQVTGWYQQQTAGFKMSYQLETRCIHSDSPKALSLRAFWHATPGCSPPYLRGAMALGGFMHELWQGLSGLLPPSFHYLRVELFKFNNSQAIAA